MGVWQYKSSPLPYSQNILQKRQRQRKALCQTHLFGREATIFIC